MSVPISRIMEDWRLNLLRKWRAGVWMAALWIFIPYHASSEPVVAEKTAEDVQQVEIVVDSYSFKPDHLVVVVNHPVELTLKSVTRIVPPNFVLQAPEAGLEVSENVGPGKKVTVTFTPHEPGRYQFICNKKLLFFKSHDAKGMVGILDVVQEDSSIPFVALPLHAQAQDRYPAENIEADQMTINGIGLKTTEAEVRQKLGDPDSIDTYYDECARGEGKDLVYPVGNITFLDGSLVRFQCFGELCETADGVRPGMPRNRVLETYGEGYHPKHRDAIVYSPSNEKFCHLFIAFESDHVKSISIWCAVC